MSVWFNPEKLSPEARENAISAADPSRFAPYLVWAAAMAMQEKAHSNSQAVKAAYDVFENMVAERDHAIVTEKQQVNSDTEGWFFVPRIHSDFAAANFSTEVTMWQSSSIRTAAMYWVDRSPRGQLWVASNGSTLLNNEAVYVSRGVHRVELEKQEEPIANGILHQEGEVYMANLKQEKKLAVEPVPTGIPLQWMLCELALGRLGFAILCDPDPRDVAAGCLIIDNAKVLIKREEDTIIASTRETIQGHLLTKTVMKQIPR